MRKLHAKQSGFTIIELMISTTIFTMVLFVAAMAIVHVGRMYFKGTIISKTQDTGRRLGEDVAQAIQFGARSDSDAEFRREGTALPLSNGTQSVTANSICFGGIRYTYVLNRPLGTGATQSRHVLWKDRVLLNDTSCVPRNMLAVTPSIGGEEFLANNMRIAQFDIPSSSTGIYNISIIVATGADDGLFETGTTPPLSICKGTNAGGQFCATSLFRTSVGKRL